MPKWPAIDTNPHYDELTAFVGHVQDLETGELKPERMTGPIAEAIAQEAAVVAAAAAAAETAVANELEDLDIAGAVLAGDDGDVKMTVGGAITNVKPGRVDAKARGLSAAATATANQTLLNALLAEAATNGAELWIGDGEFTTNQLALQTHSRVGGTGTLRHTGTAAILRAEAKSDIGVSGIGLLGTYVSGGITGNDAISLEDVSDFALSRVKIKNWKGTAVGLVNVKDAAIDRLETDTLAAAAVRMHETTGAGRRNERIWITRSTLLRSQLSDQWGNGAVQTHGGGNLANELWVLQNHIDGAWVGLGLDGSDNVNAHYNRITNCKGESIAMSGERYDISHNVIDACGAAGILMWLMAGTKGQRITWNDVWDCAQGVGFVFGEADLLIEDVYIAFNRLQRNGWGVQSYIDLGDLPEEDWGTLGYKNVTVCFNDLVGNTNGPTNFIRTGAFEGYVRHFANFSEDGGALSPLSQGHAYWEGFNTFAGAEGAESVEYAVNGIHADSGDNTNPSEVRFWAGFDFWTPGAKGAGFGARKAAAFGNSVDLVLYNTYLNTVNEALVLNAEGTITAGGPISQPVTTITATGEITSLARTVYVDATAGDVVATLPWAGAIDAGTSFLLKRVDTSANSVTISPFMNDWIEGSNQSFTLDEQGAFLSLVSESSEAVTGWWIEGRSPTRTVPLTITETTDLDRDAKTVLVDASAGPITVTLPYTDWAGPEFEITLKRIDNTANAVLVETFMADWVDGSNQTLSLDFRNDHLTVVVDPDHGWIITARAPRHPVLQTFTASGSIELATETVVVDATAGAVTVELPYAEAVPRGHRVTIKKIDASANAVTVEGFLNDKIDGANNASLAAQWDVLTVVNGAVGAWYAV